MAHLCEKSFWGIVDLVSSSSMGSKFRIPTVEKCCGCLQLKSTWIGVGIIEIVFGVFALYEIIFESDNYKHFGDGVKIFRVFANSESGEREILIV